MAAGEDAASGGSSMEEQLFQAIQEGGTSPWKAFDRKKVVRLMDVLGRSVLANLRTPTGIHVLNYAILNYNFRSARLLLQRGVDASSKDANGRTALHAAATVDDAGVLLDILKRYNEVNVKDDEDDTPLHEAIRKSSTEAIKWLVFAGADPFSVNKWGVACRKLTRKMQVLKILQNHRKGQKIIIFTLDTKAPYTSADLPCSIQLAQTDDDEDRVQEEKEGEGGDEETESQGGNSFAYCSTSAEEVRGVKLREDEEALAPVVQYRLLQAVTVDLVFPLTDQLEEWEELVLRLLTEAGVKNDIALQVKECVPWWYQSSKPARKGPVKVGFGSGITVAEAGVRVKLEPAGSMLLMTRPVQQPLVFEKGRTEVTSNIDKDVKLQVVDDFQGKIEGSLQLERSVPIKEDPSLKTTERPKPAEKDVIGSQSDYYKVVITVSVTKTDHMTMQLPLPGEYTGSPLALYYRLSSGQSDWSASESEADDEIEVDPWEQEQRGRRQSLPEERSLENRQRKASSCSLDSMVSTNTASSESEADEDENEAKLWIKKQDIQVERTQRRVQVPVVINRTVTAVEVKQSVSEEKLKQQIARQYRKRRYKKAVFLICSRPWTSWRECRELLVLVTSPAYVSLEMKCYVQDGYVPVQMSGELLVPKHTTFRVSVVGDVFIEDGKGEATISYHHAIRTDKGGNVYRFVVRKHSEEVMEAGIMIEKMRRKKKHRALQVLPWKNLGQIKFDVTLPGIHYRPPEAGDDTVPFTESVLMELARQATISETTRLAAHLELSQASVDSIMSNPNYLSTAFKCFLILKTKRGASSSILQFGKDVMKTFHSLGWKEKCDWLLEQLKDWDRVAELKSVTT